MKAIQQDRFQSRTIRFRQWSRKGYAVFCSLGMNVTIAVLNMALSVRMTRKNAVDGLIDDLKSLFDFSNEENQEVLELEDFMMSESMLVVPSFVKADGIEVVNKKYELYSPVDFCRQGFSFM